MNTETVDLLQHSWQKVVRQRDVAATRFYEQLFAIDPQLRRMFPADMTAQKRKLMMLLNVAVIGLRDVEALQRVLASLGRQHAGYGVRPEHYAAVGKALIRTVAECLGSELTGEVNKAWADMYAMAARAMQQAEKSDPPSNPIKPYSRHLVQGSWLVGKPKGNAIARTFYDKLHATEPAAIKVLPEDPSVRVRNLVRALSTVVDRLSAPEQLMGDLHDLAARHQRLGVHGHYYDACGDALLWSLHKHLGDLFSGDVELAWRDVSSFLAGTMKQRTSGHSQWIH